MAFSTLAATAKKFYSRAALGLKVMTSGVSAFYDGGESGQWLRTAWDIMGLSADAQLLPNLKQMRNRSQKLTSNEGLAAAIMTTMTANIVGQRGLRPQAKPKTRRLPLSDDEAATFRDEAEWYWSLLAKKIDIGKRMTMAEIQRLCFRSVFENGEFIVLIRNKVRPGIRFHLCIEVLDPARLGRDLLLTHHEGRQIRGGVELGIDGEPVAYWIRKATPGDLSASGDASNFVRIPAKYVLHLYDVERAGQSRGKPLLAPVLNLFHDLSKYRETEVIAARVAACMAVFITGGDAGAQSAANRSPFSGSSAENAGVPKLKKLHPGMIGYLGAGTEVTSFDPKRPNPNTNEFIYGLMQQICAALGLPALVVLKDFSKTNYSSARAALLEARRMYRIWQEFISSKLCQPLYELMLTEAVDRNWLLAPDFHVMTEEYCVAKWLGEGWQSVDPLKEINAAVIAIEHNISTLSDEISARSGDDWEEVAEQRGREVEKLRLLKIDKARLEFEYAQAAAGTLIDDTIDHEDDDDDLANAA